VVAENVVDDIVPAVLKDLENIGDTLKTAVEDVTKALADIVIPVAEDEYEIFVSVLKSLNTLVCDVESTLESILKSVSVGESCSV
jgi:hypothetical protein